MSSDNFRASNGDVLKGMVAGIIGGLVASWAMNEFQSVWIKTVRYLKPRENSETSKESDDTEPATVKAAEVVSKKVLGHYLTEDEKDVAGNAVHYATGGGVAGFYGAVAELAPQVTAGGGLPFGTAVWLVVDEAVVPLLNLSKGPTAYPISTHAYALVSHFVYGVTTEVVRSTLRRTVLR